MEVMKGPLDLYLKPKGLMVPLQDLKGTPIKNTSTTLRHRDPWDVYPSSETSQVLPARVGQHPWEVLLVLFLVAEWVHFTPVWIILSLIELNVYAVLGSCTQQLSIQDARTSYAAVLGFRLTALGLMV